MGLNKETYGVWNQADADYIDDENIKNTKDLNEHNKSYSTTFQRSWCNGLCTTFE